MEEQESKQASNGRGMGNKAASRQRAGGGMKGVGGLIVGFPPRARTARPFFLVPFEYFIVHARWGIIYLPSSFFLSFCFLYFGKSSVQKESERGLAAGSPFRLPSRPPSSIRWRGRGAGAGSRRDRNSEFLYKVMRSPRRRRRGAEQREREGRRRIWGRQDRALAGVLARFLWPGQRRRSASATAARPPAPQTERER